MSIYLLNFSLHMWFDFTSLFFFFFKTEEGEISGSDEESGDEDRVSGHILDKLGVYIINVLPNSWWFHVNFP